MSDLHEAERRMTPAELSKALHAVGLPMRRFCRITKTNYKTAERWLAGERDIPGWVPIVLKLLELPNAITIAEAASASGATENER